MLGNDTTVRSSTRAPWPAASRVREVLTAGLVLALVVSVLSVVDTSPALADDVDTTDRVRDLLEDNSDASEVGLYLRAIGGSVHAAHNELFMFEPASTIKALVHVHAMRDVQVQVAGGADLDDVLDGTTITRQTNTCPSGDESESLRFALRAMMVPSNNFWTEALRDEYGNAAIDQTRATLGMDDSQLQRVLGCGGVPTDEAQDPNTPTNHLTLVDAGLLYEAAATWFLAPAIRSAAFGLMLSDENANLTSGQYPEPDLYDAITDEEAVGLVLSAAAVEGFKAERRHALKAGSVSLTDTSYLSVAGWGELGFKDAACEVVPREYTFGAFIHDADPDTITIDTRTAATELFREQIRDGLESWAACEADLEVASVDFHDPPAALHVNTPTALTVRHVVRNNGPADTADADLTTLVSAPADCDVQPALDTQTVPGLADGVDVIVDTQVVLTCTQPSFHEVFADAWIAPTDPNVTDPNPGNDANHGDATLEVFAHADLAVVGLDLAELDGAGLGDLLVGQPFDFDVPLSVRNFGDIVGSLYDTPVDADISRSLEVPAGLTGSVTVTADEAPATVVVQADGQPPVVHGNQPTGAVFAADGPVTLTVQSTTAAIAMGPARVLDTSFGLQCSAPGTHDMSVAAAIEPSNPHVIDPEPNNDLLEAHRAVECVTPVQINIRPGNPHNFVQPGSKQAIPVAILTTAAGEYGLPVAFDAATVEPASVRFGTVEVLGGSGGAEAFKHVIRDSFEMDDKTKDGDFDMALLTWTPGSGIDADTAEACLTGTYHDEHINPLTFFGCDAVATPPGQGS